MSEPKSIEEVPSWVIVNALRCPIESQISIVAKLLQHLDRDQRAKALSMCWREISKELPPEHESVLVRLDDDIYLIGVMDSNNEWGIYWSDGRNAEDPERPVTHWMPIPACT